MQLQCYFNDLVFVRLQYLLRESTVLDRTVCVVNSYLTFNAKLMHVTFKICTYALSELTVLKFIRKKDKNVLCEGKKLLLISSIQACMRWTVHGHCACNVIRIAGISKWVSSSPSIRYIINSICISEKCHQMSEDILLHFIFGGGRELHSESENKWRQYQGRRSKLISKINSRFLSTRFVFSGCTPKYLHN